VSVFTKRDPQAAAGFYEVEAAGLRWLGEAVDGVPVGRVLEVTATSISLPRYPTVEPTRAAAVEFGRRLALTHRAGADHHGAAPPGCGDGFIATLPLRHRPRPPVSWGAFYAADRVEPFAAAAEAAGSLDAASARAVRVVVERLRAGDPALTGPEVPAARVHGDLWNGNVLWTPSGARLIDPAAHGGHPETDLAMLALFGLPHLETVLVAYEDASALPTGWRERVGLHQLHPLLVHAVLFGPSYGAQAGAVARRYG
jgi:fructosamine-3-kinase